MKTNPHQQQPFIPEEPDAWALEDFSDLALPRKVLTDETLETFRGRTGPHTLEQMLFESLFDHC